ncbi:transposon Tf2-9 polyprotein [Trichonephila clavipes]|nr:transposon Tf2-9 polyprotein [Trichonephila clavipes]
MAEVTAVKIPPYNFSDPQLWFFTRERTFALGILKAITDTCTKFNYIVSNLPPEAAAIVRDLIITPDETDPYGAIKAQMIQRTRESSQQEIRKLLTAANDLSANYLGIHHANNRRESRRSHRRNPRSEHSQRFTFDKRHRFIQRNRILQEIERLNKRIDDLTMRQRTPERRNNSRSRNHSRN